MGLGPEAHTWSLCEKTDFPESHLCLAFRVLNLFQERNWGPASRGVFGLNKSALYEWQLSELREALLASTAWLYVQMSQPGQLPRQDASLALSLIEHCS